MRCPKCDFEETKVIDTRTTEDGKKVRRRRECISCTHRFTTYEKIEESPLLVVKRDGNRQEYNRNKIVNGIIRACEKRPITSEQINTIANNIEKAISNKFTEEIPAKEIGEFVMNELKKVDDVAYVRFASVYREFKDINTFMKELERMLREKE